jgi:hypothetical protein
MPRSAEGVYDIGEQAGLSWVQLPLAGVERAVDAGVIDRKRQVVDPLALVSALGSGRLSGAALDVTDPEPLPDGHPLWELSNCLITPYIADTEEVTRPLLAGRITENVRRLANGEELIGRVDPGLGY